MRTNIALAALAVAGLSVPAAAQGQNANQVAPKASQTKYCIEYETATGSRIRAKECLTKEQWARRGVDVDGMRK